MDKRDRVLVVEDVAIARESYVANLELAERYRVDAAGSREEALAAIKRCAYHVAVVDIMLAGPRDVANRDGVEVARQIQRLAEGTRVVMLSAQRDETELVGNLVQDYGVFKYLDKRTLERDGVTALLETVERAAKASGASTSTWESLVASLAPKRGEPEVVSEIMQHLDFSGGFEVLSRMLVHTARHLVPLLVPQDLALLLRRDADGKILRGTYWSKGQGQAVDLYLAGRDSASSALPAADADGLLLDSEKAGLRLLVLARPELERGQFRDRLRGSEDST
jgi:CheY-like chemotaxis protein